MWRWCFAIESGVIKSIQPLNSNIIKTNIDPRLWDVHTQIGVSVKDGGRHALRYRRYLQQEDRRRKSRTARQNTSIFLP